jgi:hypothetical protein
VGFGAKEGPPTYGIFEIEDANLNQIKHLLGRNIPKKWANGPNGEKYPIGQRIRSKFALRIDTLDPLVQNAIATHRETKLRWSDVAGKLIDKVQEAQGHGN